MLRLSKTLFGCRSLLSLNTRIYPTFSWRVFSSGHREPGAVSPGGTDGHIPMDLDQSAGIKYEETVLRHKGLRRHNDGPIVGPFGTVSQPTLISSTMSSRFVGCTGGEGHKSHEILWMNLKAGPKHACSQCGQIFLLVSGHDHDNDPNQPRTNLEHAHH